MAVLSWSWSIFFRKPTTHWRSQKSWHTSTESHQQWQWNIVELILAIGLVKVLAALVASVDKKNTTAVVVDDEEIDEYNNYVGAKLNIQTD